MLDNVADPTVVRPLIPAGPESAVLIAGCQPMWTLDANLRVAANELSVATVTALMLTLAGGDRSGGRDESPEHRRTTTAVVKLCGQLPLTLSIVAARLISRPDLSLTVLARRLRDECTRLDELCFEGLSVRNSLIRCRQQLCGPNASADDLAATRLFDVIGCLNTRRLDVRRVAMMMEEPAAVVTRARERLVDVGMVTAVGSPGRYCVPELTLSVPKMSSVQVSRVTW